MIKTDIALTVKRDTNDIFIGVCAALMVALIHAGMVAFVNYGGHFDATSLFFLLLTVYSKNPYLVAMSLFLGYYNDERTLLGGLFVGIYYLLNHNKKNFMAYLIAGVLYAVTRIFIMNYFNLPLLVGKETGVSEFILNKKIETLSFQMHFLRALEGAWWVVILALGKIKNIWLTAALLVSILLVSFAAGFVWDVQRSYTYMLPIIYVSYLVLVKFYPVEKLRKISIAIVIICFIIPSHPFAYFKHDVGPANFFVYELIEWFKN